MAARETRVHRHEILAAGDLSMGASRLICIMVAVLALAALAAAQLPKNFIQVPQRRQATDYTCGVASTACVLNYWTGEDWLEDELSKQLKANDQEGTRYRNIAKFAESEGYTVQLMFNMTLTQLTGIIDQGTPVIVLIQAWPDRYPVNWVNDWDDGHFVVICGYDDANIYMMDPSTTGHYTYIPRAQFLDRWHDIDGPSERVVHFGILLTLPTPPVYDPSRILPLD